MTCQIAVKLLRLLFITVTHWGGEVRRGIGNSTQKF